MSEPIPLIVPFSADHPTLELVGGKALALAALIRAGLPVPAGFIVSTKAYRDFVAANDLQNNIIGVAAAVDAQDLAAADQASSSIRAWFDSAQMPPAVVSAVEEAYAELSGPVAVRSSATAEDLPEMSFAGQQDSFLNVQGSSAVLAALRRCWASLWTARAITYRDRMGVAHDAVSMGVVVQVMVDADVAGILFTANPTSGDRSELVINASYGLGEAVVGGLVMPDTFVLERDNLRLKEQQIGSKDEMLGAAERQGTQTFAVSRDRRRAPSLTPHELADLAACALQAEQVMRGVPQDIEWAVVDGVCWLLQSRPITGLPPAPAAWLPPNPQAKLVRRQVVENMPEPLSPLFEELYLNEGLDRGMDLLMTDIMQLPFNVDAFIARPMFVTVNGYGYCRIEPQFSRRMLALLPRMLLWYVLGLPKLLKNLVPLWRDEGLPAYLDTIKLWRSTSLEDATDEDLLRGLRELAYADAAYWFYITMMVGVAKLSEGMLSRLLAARVFQGRLISGMFLRGFESKTLESQGDLATIAGRIKASPVLRKVVEDGLAGDLLDILAATPGGAEIVQAVERHLDVYGHQVYNLDFVAPTQAEDPLPVLMNLQALVHAGADSPGDVERRTALVAEREQLVADTAASLGPVRRRVFRKLLGWAQRFGPYREQALFYMGAGWPVLRRLALAFGARLTEAGILVAADDVFYLGSAELERARLARVRGEICADLAPLAQERRALRAERQQLHPPARVPQDMRFKFGPFDFTRYFEVWETQKHNVGNQSTLHGFAVSPGRVTGVASVILSAEDFGSMQADTILVCPTTTPAWTPLFAQAAGLVTDIGGILAHGSIVAREYGIPAVLGTGNVTQRITSGQRICVDGSAGTVTILD